MRLVCVVFLANIFVKNSSHSVFCNWYMIEIEAKPFSCAHNSYRSVRLTDISNSDNEFEVCPLGNESPLTGVILFHFLAGSSVCTALAFGHIAILKLILRTPQQ